MARWQISERRREDLVARVRSLSVEAQQARPDPKEFAPTEILEHLAMTEAMYLDFIRVLPQAKPSKPNFLYRYTVKKCLAGSRLPTVKSLVPDSAPSLEEAAARWNDVRQKLLGELDGALPGLTVVRHPFFGRLSTEDMLELMDAHCTYHDIRFPVLGASAST